MKKKILMLLLSLVFCICMSVPAFAAQTDGFTNEYKRVQDLAGLLSESEEEALSAKLEEICSRQKMDIVVLTTNTLDGKTPRDYAGDIYDQCDFGYGEEKDGLLFLVSMEERDWYISTCGYGITAFTDAGIQYIGEKMTDDLAAGNYAAAFNTFANLSDEFITQARSGSPYDSDNLPSEPFDLMWIPISIAGGFILARIKVRRMKAQLKTVRYQAAASNYMKKGSLNITDKQDLFLYNTVSRRDKPKNNSSSGGSSTHTSSSGRTHGGGGGKF